MNCALVLMSYLSFGILSQGTQLNSTEATETFFAVTKLFQSKDVTLRRLVYLAIKEMSRIADDVIIVTSSLTKDMTGKEDQYRASAIRALCTVIDVCGDWDVQDHCHLGTLSAISLGVWLNHAKINNL